MIFRQLFDRDTCTYTYVLGDPRTREAILVDSVNTLAERDAALLREMDLKLVATVETHVHADHITGAWRLKALTGCNIVFPASSGLKAADRLIHHGELLRFGDSAVKALATPGHTATCTSFAAEGLVMTGDALFVRGCGRTDFQGGSAETLYDSVWGHILSMPEHTHIYPGHDYMGHTRSTVREERAFNPRLGGGRTREDFVAIMDNLNLDHPRYIKVALPGNRALGRTADDGEIPGAWNFMARNERGARQVGVEWVREHRAELRLVDVREPEEVQQGHIPGADLVPVGRLGELAPSWERAEPVVLICRSGVRSDRGAVQLEALGFGRVASMTGGMLAWSP